MTHACLKKAFIIIWECISADTGDSSRSNTDREMTGRGNVTKKGWAQAHTLTLGCRVYGGWAVGCWAAGLPGRLLLLMQFKQDACIIWPNSTERVSFSIKGWKRQELCWVFFSLHLLKLQNKLKNDTVDSIASRNGPFPTVTPLDGRRHRFLYRNPGSSEFSPAPAESQEVWDFDHVRLSPAFHSKYCCCVSAPLLFGISFCENQICGVFIISYTQPASCWH